MSSEKSVVTIPQTPRNLCPVCGKAAYSLGGIHPQCAIQQADEPRVVKMRAARVAAEPKAKKAAEPMWKKRCPSCGAQTHVRRETCECGHKFGKS